MGEKMKKFEDKNALVDGAIGMDFFIFQHTQLFLKTNNKTH